MASLEVGRRYDKLVIDYHDELIELVDVTVVDFVTHEDGRREAVMAVAATAIDESWVIQINDDPVV